MNDGSGVRPERVQRERPLRRLSAPRRISAGVSGRNESSESDRRCHWANTSRSAARVCQAGTSPARATAVWESLVEDRLAYRRVRPERVQRERPRHQQRCRHPRPVRCVRPERVQRERPPLMSNQTGRAHSMCQAGTSPARATAANSSGEPPSVLFMCQAGTSPARATAR